MLLSLAGGLLPSSVLSRLPTAPFRLRQHRGRSRHNLLWPHRFVGSLCVCLPQRMGIRRSCRFFVGRCQTSRFRCRMSCCPIRRRRNHVGAPLSQGIQGSSLGWPLGWLGRQRCSGVNIRILQLPLRDPCPTKPCAVAGIAMPMNARFHLA